ncbi:MAG: amidohydrolase family protein [Candidatus Acidiferrales bacterium]
MRPASLLISLLFLAAPLVAQSPAARQPIIDVHLHALPVDFLGEEFDVPGMTRPASDEVNLRAALAGLERYNIIRAIVSGPLELVERWRQADPERLVGSPVFPHFFPPPSLDRIREDVRTNRIGALGEITAQYGGLSPSDPQLEPIFALAEELDLPVGIHTGLGPPGSPYHCCPEFRMDLGRPLLLEELLVRHPRLRVYLMHAGYPHQAETVALLSMYPQVYADIAVLNWALPREEFHTYLRGLIRAGLGNRLMFGSDQMVWPEAIGMAIEGVESAEFLSAEQKRDIFCRNAARFLRLDLQVCE